MNQMIDAGFTYQIGRPRSARVRVTKSQPVAAEISLFQIARRGRFWEVRDAAGDLVCLTAYKKGAIEVVRRLAATQTATEASHCNSPV